MPKDMESFDECSRRLSQLMRDHGLPSREKWVDWGDVIVDKGRYYVYGSKSEDRSCSSEARFRLAAEKDVGIALEAICTVNDATCCFVYLPSSQDEAERLMIPQSGVKLSVPMAPPEAKLVTNAFAWWLRRLRARDHLKSTHS
jgi:hypothetical protein